MEKNTVRIQNMTLGAGIPKVCVPVMGKDLREWTEAATAAREQADLIELRLDSVSPELDADRVRQACRVVREKAQGSALLATMRTSRDGGAGDGDAERYETLLVMLARERLCDVLDVELSVGEAALRALHRRRMRRACRWSVRITNLAERRRTPRCLRGCMPWPGLARMCEKLR